MDRTQLLMKSWSACVEVMHQVQRQNDITTVVGDQILGPESHVLQNWTGYVPSHRVVAPMPLHQNFNKSLQMT